MHRPDLEGKIHVAFQQALRIERKTMSLTKIVYADLARLAAAIDCESLFPFNDDPKRGNNFGIRIRAEKVPSGHDASGGDVCMLSAAAFFGLCDSAHETSSILRESGGLIEVLHDKLDPRKIGGHIGDRTPTSVITLKVLDDLIAKHRIVVKTR